MDYCHFLKAVNAEISNMFEKKSFYFLKSDNWKCQVINIIIPINVITINLSSSQYMKPYLILSTISSSFPVWKAVC